MIRVATILLVVLFVGCYDSFDTPLPNSNKPSTTITIAELKRLYSGTVYDIESDIIIKGRVTSSDGDGNFNRTFTIEQSGEGIEIMAGIYDLWRIYPTGCTITINMKGLSISEAFGLIQIGTCPKTPSGYDLDYLGSRVKLDKHITRIDQIAEVEPSLTTLPKLNKSMFGSLVSIDKVTFSPENLENISWEGYKRFVDGDGNHVWTYVRKYSSFANETIPLQPLSLTGILQSSSIGGESERFIIKPRYETDCNI